MNKYIVWIEDATVGGIEEAAVANPDVQNVYFVDHTIGIMWKKMSAGKWYYSRNDSSRFHLTANEL